MKLSILIPSLAHRDISRAFLLNELQRQINTMGANKDVEVLCEIDDGQMSIGAKRNKLKDRAQGLYCSFIDDDDFISSTYIEKAFEIIDSGFDCGSLRGVITWDGDRPELFEHSIKYNAYKTNDTGAVKYERYPNHLNIIRSDIAKRFTFPEINHGEDTDWATQIHNAGVLKTEYFIDEVIYHYQYKQKELCSSCQRETQDGLCFYCCQYASK